MFDLSEYYMYLQYFDTVGWVFWPVKTRLPYNLYCFGGDVKRCSIQSICICRHLFLTCDSAIRLHSRKCEINPSSHLHSVSATQLLSLHSISFHCVKILHCHVESTYLSGWFEWPTQKQHLWLVSVVPSDLIIVCVWLMAWLLPFKNPIDLKWFYWCRDNIIKVNIDWCT